MQVAKLHKYVDNTRSSNFKCGAYGLPGIGNGFDDDSGDDDDDDDGDDDDDDDSGDDDDDDDDVGGGGGGGGDSDDDGDDDDDDDDCGMLRVVPRGGKLYRISYVNPN